MGFAKKLTPDVSEGIWRAEYETDLKKIQNGEFNMAVK